MQILAALIILALVAFMALSYAGGYPNTIDAIAYRLHRHAREMRRMHRERERIVTERWVRTLEGAE